MDVEGLAPLRPRSELLEHSCSKRAKTRGAPLPAVRILPWSSGPRCDCQVADAAKSVVQIAYDIGGGTSVYESCPLQRCFRDTYAALQHVQVQGGNFEIVGRILLGLDAGTPIL